MIIMFCQQKTQDISDKWKYMTFIHQTNLFHCLLYNIATEPFLLFSNIQRTITVLKY